MQPNGDFNFIQELSKLTAYPHEKVSHVDVNETHISWILFRPTALLIK